MKTIRKSAFETNSSSTHSITIDSSYLGRCDVKDLEIECDEFGWEFVKFNDFRTKASYFWTLAHTHQNHPLFDRMIRLSRKYKFGLLYPRTDQYCYIDHNFEHYDSWIEESPQLDTDEGLMDFMVSNSGWMFLGNDNDDDPPNFRMTSSQVEKAPYFLTLLEDKTLRYGLQDLEHSTIDEYASRAAYWHLKHSIHNRGYVNILSIDNEIIQVVIEKYDSKTGKYLVISDYTLHYEIETNNYCE